MRVTEYEVVLPDGRATWAGDAGVAYMRVASYAGVDREIARRAVLGLDAGVSTTVSGRSGDVLVERLESENEARYRDAVETALHEWKALNQ